MNEITIKTQLTSDFKVVQEISIMESVTRTVIDVAAAQSEEKIKEALIKLGWTPPVVK